MLSPYCFLALIAQRKHPPYTTNEGVVEDKLDQSQQTYDDVERQIELLVQLDEQTLEKGEFHVKSVRVDILVADQHPTP